MKYRGATVDVKVFLQKRDHWSKLMQTVIHETDLLSALEHLIPPFMKFLTPVGSEKVERFTGMDNLQNIIDSKQNYIQSTIEKIEIKIYYKEI